MDGRAGNTLAYEKPTEAGGPVQIETFPDGGVTVFIPRLASPAAHGFIAVGVALAFVVMGAVLVRSPAFVLMSVPAALVVGLAAYSEFKSRTDPPDVIGLSRRSVYVATSRFLARREFEEPLASLSDISAAPPDEPKGRVAGSIQLTLSHGVDVTLFSDRPLKEIRRVVEALKRSWETLRAAEDAMVRHAVTAFVQVCEQHPGADDRALVAKLCEAGMDPALAARITVLVPMAFARMLYKDDAAFHPYCLIVDGRGKPLRRLDLAKDRFFRGGGELVRDYCAEPADAALVRRVADRSAEGRAVAERMAERKKGRLISLRPARIPPFGTLYDSCARKV